MITGAMWVYPNQTSIILEKEPVEEEGTAE
jgi:hypothetical protein